MKRTPVYACVAVGILLFGGYLALTVGTRPLAGQLLDEFTIGMSGDEALALGREIRGRSDGREILVVDWRGHSIPGTTGIFQGVQLKTTFGLRDWSILVHVEGDEVKEIAMHPTDWHKKKWNHLKYRWKRRFR